MADEFQPYHVPQQSRRDKLRVLPSDLLLPFYDPSLIPSDFQDAKDKNTTDYVFMDPQSSGLSFQEISSSPFLYSHQNLRFLDQSLVPLANNNNNSKTGQGLSLSLSSHHHHFTGYALILKGSRFLKPAQHLLEEICVVGRGNYAAGDDDSEVVTDLSPETPTSDYCSDEHTREKSMLISMLHEVYRKYKQYYQQLQAVVASFENVPGLGNAAPFANLSLKTLSKHFRSLKNAITDQLQHTGKSHGQINCESDSIRTVVNHGKDIYNCQRPAIHNAGFVDHQFVWRPQRGLPERAVTVLRAWLFDHFLHPYPTDTDKVMLAKQTGLSRNQVSNWFINARVRIWKPMVEEIHMLETRQAQKAASSHKEASVEHFPTSNSLPSPQQFQDVSLKRTRNNGPVSEETHLGGDDQETMNLSHDNFTTHSRAGNTSGVSLTLGLQHQNNNGVGLSDSSFPRNAARRFGIDANNEGFLFGSSFQAQNRHELGRDIIGGKLLHDFVG